MKSRKFKRPITIGVVVAVGLSVLFSQLPFRIQGRLVEIVALGDWPLEWAVQNHFHRRQPEIQSITDFIAEYPEVEIVSVVPEGLRASLQGEPSVGQDYENPNFLQALQSIEAYWVSVHDGQIHVFMGTEYRSGVAFGAGYTSMSASGPGIPSCDDIEKVTREKIGVCAVVLNERWFIRYQWEPEDIDEFEEALRE